MIIIYKILLFSLVLIIFFSAIAIILTILLRKDFKHYKKVYETLENRNFTLSRGKVYGYFPGEAFHESNLIFYIDDNDFKLENGVFLTNNPLCYLSPYSFYWLVKYRKWFKKNVINEINKVSRHVENEKND